MSAFHNNVLIGSSSQGYQIERSLRFNSADSAYLGRAVGTTGNRTQFTWSGWVKRSTLGVVQHIFGGYSGGSVDGGVYLDSNDTLSFSLNGNTYNKFTTAVFRDCSAWYHIVVAFDSPNATAANRIRIYINGVEQTNYTTQNSGLPPQNHNSFITLSGADLAIGKLAGYSQNYFSGYLTEVHFIDGQALTPSSFGEINPVTGVWQPKRYSGTYGTNGFYLKFADNSGTTSTTLGKDSSGNGNNWTPNNFSAAIGSSSWSFSTQRENDYRDGTIISGITGFTSASFSGTYNWGGNTGGSLSNTMALRDSSNTVIASTSVSGASGSWSLSATGLSTSTTYHLFISASSSGGSFMERNSYGSFTTSYGGRASDTDSFIDTPTPYADGGNGRGNYCTWNPIYTIPSNTTTSFTNGNLDFSVTQAESVGEASAVVTMPLPTTGKWYWEITPTTVATLASTRTQVGVMARATISYAMATIGADNFSYAASGQKNNNATFSTYGNPYTANDVISVAVDLDNGAIYFAKNGTWQNSGDPTSGSSKTGAAFATLTGSKEYFPAVGYWGAFAANFGQRPFAYTPPAGFLALNTQNLPEPSIKKPSSYMDVVTYTGTGSALTPTTGLGFSPDLVWIKSRSAATDHALYDVMRGTEKRLEPNNTDAEVTSDSGVTAFNSAGFTLGTLAQVNTNTATYVAWCWDESATPGFDIVTWAAQATAGTVAHSLGVVPKFIIYKSRDNAAYPWFIYHSDVGIQKYMQFSTAASTTNSTVFTTAPTSTVFDPGTGVTTGNGYNAMVAYLWSEVAGFSKFGSYTGNGSSTDGPFVHLGFRPRYLLVKRSDSANDWLVFDSARDQYNETDDLLYPNLSNAEASNSATDFDFLSNGFKLRAANANQNASGGTYIYAAFAETPFRYSLAR